MPAPAISTAKQSDQGGLADLLGIAPEVTSANAIYGMCIEGVVSFMVCVSRVGSHIPYME